MPSTSPRSDKGAPACPLPPTSKSMTARGELKDTPPDGSGPVPSREPGGPLTHHTDAPATGGDWHKVACGITHARAGSITSGFDGTTCPDCRKALGLPEIP